MIYWWFLHTQNSSWHFTLQMEGNTQDKKVVTSCPCSNTLNQNTTRLEGSCTLLSLDSLWISLDVWVPEQQVYDTLPLKTRQFLSEMCKWYNIKFFHFTFAWYYGLSAFSCSDKNCLQIPTESKWSVLTGFNESQNGFFCYFIPQHMISVSLGSIKYCTWYIKNCLTKKKDPKLLFLMLHAFSMPIALQAAALL